MERYIRTLQTIDVYNDRSAASPVIKKIPAGILLNYYGEKRRDRINWLEIDIDNNITAYVKNNRKDIFICEAVKLVDDEAQGFDYLPLGKERPMTELLVPEAKYTIDNKANDSGKSAGVTAIRVADAAKNKKEFLTLKYDPSQVSVTTFAIRKNEEFYLTYKDRSYSSVFIEVDNLYGKKGYLLHSTSVMDLRDGWIHTLAIIIAILTVIAIILAFLAAGWIVAGAILVIPGLIVGVLVAIVLKMLLHIIRNLAHEIMIRL